MLLQNIKKIIYHFDLFYSEQLLRYNANTQYKTLTGGLLSLMIIIVIIIGFASMIIDTFNRTSITSALTTTKQSDPPLQTLIPGKQNMFMFSLSVLSTDTSFSANLSQTPKIFDVQMSILHIQYGNFIDYTPVQLQMCTKQHWSMFPSFQNKFQIYGASSWLCLPLDYPLPIQGVYSSPLNKQILITVYKCNNQTNNNTCASKEEIDALFKTHGNFYLNFNYINPNINPNQQNYISHYIEDYDYVIFSQSIGSQAWIYFSDYTIQTDKSILPYTDQVIQKGCIVQTKAINHPYGVSDDKVPLVTAYLARSVNSLSYTRQVQKISAVFSYIGGLVGAVTAFLFLMKAYTDSSLQIAIAFSLFQEASKNEVDMEAAPKKKFNIFSYVLLTFYRFIKSLGWKGIWQYQKMLQKYQNEALKQLDIQLIIKRIIKIQACISQILSSKQIEAIKQQKQITVDIAQKMRELLLKTSKSLQTDTRKSIIEQNAKKDMKVQICSDFQGISNGESHLQSGVQINKFQNKLVSPSYHGQFNDSSVKDIYRFSQHRNEDQFRKKNQKNVIFSEQKNKIDEVKKKMSALIVKNKENSTIFC